LLMILGCDRNQHTRTVYAQFRSGIHRLTMKLNSRN
jgi:hypothetical protein